MNKPVAWMCQDNVTDEWEFSSMKHCYKCEPLYTHPVKEEHFEDEPQAEELHEILQSNTHPVKELTDEEIVKLYEETSFFGVLDPVKFARAILRKAQEK